ncbi:uncharacterized protein CELE_C18D11.10 [Caenorhabditis elegans]|uniref:Uncharacterized protein n=1 Tax=Caenorhabditis elegans TaxID=6239 RepID=C8JQS7_CAEEL|nr:Uncharacterized protein CELE_C18D11.10 [Caenorhabditis elegans]CBB16050.1 Uncharacterized protein CELE_C18D11.10 [Caenorhabditis elegans]|eukprot:NP_001255141.1 Uncharacterized protein CELE_C18D11.10 [Caenorhabditis elegans]
MLVFGAFCAPAKLKDKVGEHALTWTIVEASQTPHIRTRRYYGGWGFARPWGFGGYGIPTTGYPFWG